MDLLLDIGNTRAKYILYDKGTYGEVQHCSGQQLKGELEQLFQTEQIQNVAISNVGQELSPALITFLYSHSSHVLVVDGTMKLPVQLHYDTPRTLGADRICAVVGAQALYPDQNCMIFDFGTAMTIDFLDHQRGYLGGNISLGLGTRLNAIQHYTSKLPLLSPEEEHGEIGTTTRSAVAAGIILGMVYEIERYIDKYPDYRIIFTGGDAIYFEKEIKNPTFVVWNLVFVGLAQILEFYEF